MLGNFSWFQPAPRNFRVDPRRLRIWRRWQRRYEKSQTFQLLKQIESQREIAALASTGDGNNAYWLMPYRPQLRRIFSGFSHVGHGDEVDVIRYYMAYCPLEMFPVCIWMIGKCAPRFRLYGISNFRCDPSPQVRKHVAKALRRLEAWTLLEEMAIFYPDDDKIQCFANSPVKHRPFAARLSHYVASVDDSHAGEVLTPSPMPFWARELSWEYSPPKSVQVIRRMLRRIRHWVRWGISS